MSIIILLANVGIDKWPYYENDISKRPLSFQDIENIDITDFKLFTGINFVNGLTTPPYSLSQNYNKDCFVSNKLTDTYLSGLHNHIQTIQPVDVYIFQEFCDRFFNNYPFTSSYTQYYGYSDTMYREYTNSPEYAKDPTIYEKSKKAFIVGSINKNIGIESYINESSKYPRKKDRNPTPIYNIWFSSYL